MVSAHPLEATLRSMAPLGGSVEGPGDPVALEAVSDNTGLSSGVLGRCFVLQSERCEVRVLPPEPGRAPLSLLCSPAPLFPLSGLLLSPDGAQLALFGGSGVCCLSVAALDGSGPASTSSRRPAVLLDLSARSGKEKAAVSRVLWLNKSDVLVLLADNTAHRFQSCLAAVDPGRVVARPTGVVLKLRPPPTREEAALREFAVDAAAVEDSPELLFLLGSGEVLWSAGEGSVVNEPLRWTPAAVDNYGCDFCTLLCLSVGPLRIVVAGTTTGQLFHCLLLRSKTSAAPTLAVFDAADLALPSTVQQLSLVPDRLQPHRYFALHAAGLHIVHMPWLPELAALYQQSSAEASTERVSQLPASLVEHALCLQPLASSRPSAPAALLQIGPPAATQLLVALRNGDVVRCAVRCPLPPKRHKPEPKETPKTTTPTTAGEGELVAQLRRLFTAEAFQPLLHGAGGSTAAVCGPEALELLQRAAALLARQYLKPLDDARALLARRLEVVAARRAAQLAQLEAAEKEQRQAAATAERLLERVAAAETRAARLRSQLGRVSERLGALLPRRASRAEERAAADAKRLNARTEVLRDWLERTADKREFCARLEAENRRRLKDRSGAAGGLQTAVSKQLCAVLHDEGERIGELIAQLRSLQGQVIAS